MLTDRLTLTPVKWDENIKALIDFKNVLKTSMGPEGSAKMVVTGGNILQLTSASKPLIERLDLEHPICRYIGHVAHGLSNYGFYFGVMVSDLVEQLWKEESLPKQKLHSSVQILLEFVGNILMSNLMCKKVDFSSINCFLPLVRTVISSKCPTLVFNMDIDRLCIEIVKSFLNCIDDQTNSVGKVFVKIGTGQFNVSSYIGLLYQITEDRDIKIIKGLTGDVKILIFTVKLDNSDSKYGISVIDKIMPILKKAVDSNVRLVACQKTVAAEIRLYLMRQNIILMDRMGTTLTENLIHTTQAFPISQICIDNLPDIEKLTGTLTSVQHIECNESDYILLENTAIPISTLLIKNYSLAGTDHLQALTEQAIRSLRYLALHPTLTYGGGCLEIWLIAQTHLLKDNKNEKEFLKVAQWFQHSLLSACGPTPPDSVDSVYHHGWAIEGNSCRCGLVNAQLLDEAGGHLIPLEELVNTHSTSQVKLNSPRQPDIEVPSNVLIDSHQQKLNVIVSAIETFANIADIGFIVNKDLT